MKIFELDPRTNVLAMASFVLSLIAIGSQLADYLSGPRPRIHPPTSIALRSVPTGNGQAKIDVYATAVGLTNTAGSAYPEIVTEVLVEFTGPHGRPVQMKWWAFEQAADATPSHPDKFNETKAVSTTPQVIPGGGAIGWSTIFVPYGKECAAGSNCNRNDNFLQVDDRTAEWAARGGIEFRFVAHRVTSATPLVGTCRTPRFDPAQVDVSGMQGDFKRRGWITLACDKSA